MITHHKGGSAPAAAADGLDICRALGLGADFVLLGRAFIFGAVALGQQGSDHVADLLISDLNSNLANLGCTNLEELSSYVAG